MIIIIVTATLILPSDDIAENSSLSTLNTVDIYGSGLVMLMMIRKTDDNYENIRRYYQK